jgi:hypothetical protein
MLSERAYWIVLIFALALFSTVTVIWIMPVARDIAVNLLTDSIFTIFTVVFLTWLIRIREVSQWKLVEKKVLNRVASHLYETFETIYLYFLEPAPKMPDEFEKRIAAAEKMNFGIKREKLLSSLYAEYYAGQTEIELGEESGMDFLQNPDLEAAQGYMHEFENENDFLEHTISEYSGFLPPDLVNSVMEIEDGLQGIVTICRGIVYVDVPSLKQSHPEVFENIRQLDEKALRDAIHKIAKEIYKLNKIGLGFQSRR